MQKNLKSRDAHLTKLGQLAQDTIQATEILIQSVKQDAFSSIPENISKLDKLASQYVNTITWKTPYPERLAALVPELELAAEQAKVLADKAEKHPQNAVIVKGYRDAASLLQGLAYLVTGGPNLSTASLAKRH